MWFQDRNNVKLFIMILLTGSFMITEFIFGILSSSLSLISDGFHMSGDLISLSIGILARIYSKKKKTDQLSYGYKRAEILGGLFNSFFLISVVFFMIIEAIQRLIDPRDIEKPINVLIVGSIGLFINLLGLTIFHEHSHGHSHSNHSHSNHSHSHEEEIIEQIDTLIVVSEDIDKKEEKFIYSSNMHGVFLHILSDALGSIAVIFSALCSWLLEWEYKKYIDPLVTIFICFLILLSTFPLLKYSVKIVLQAVHENIDINKLKKDILNIDGVNSIHEFHIWLLTDSTSIATLHISCKNLENFMNIAQDIQKCMHSHNIHSVTIQPEFGDNEECTVTCDDICNINTCCQNE